MPLRASESHPSSSDRKTQLTDFLQNPPNHPRALPVHNVIHIPKSQFSILDFYFDICERHIFPARVLTPALKFAPKVLSLTKPKGKIYKTKSLGHYITIQAYLKDIREIQIVSSRICTWLTKTIVFDDNCYTTVPPYVHRWWWWWWLPYLHGWSLSLASHKGEKIKGKNICTSGIKVTNACTTRIPLTEWLGLYSYDKTRESNPLSQTL